MLFSLNWCRCLNYFCAVLLHTNSFIFHYLYDVLRHPKLSPTGHCRHPACFQLRTNSLSLLLAQFLTSLLPAILQENQINNTFACPKLNTFSKSGLLSISIALSFSNLQVKAGTIHVQDGFDVIRDYNHYKKLSSFQIFSIPELRDIPSSIARSNCSGYWSKINTDDFLVPYICGWL